MITANDARNIEEFKTTIEFNRRVVNDIIIMRSLNGYKDVTLCEHNDCDQEPIKYLDNGGMKELSELEYYVEKYYTKKNKWAAFYISWDDL